MPLFFIFIIFNIHSYNTITHQFILRHSQRAAILYFHRCSAQQEKPTWDSETRLPYTASRSTTNWATPHPAELRCTLLSNAAPQEQRRPPNEQRRSRTNIHCTVIRFVSTSAKFSICTIVGNNGALVEAKICSLYIQGSPQVRILTSTSVPLSTTTVQMSNLPLNETKRITVCLSL